VVDHPRYEDLLSLSFVLASQAQESDRVAYHVLRGLDVFFTSSFRVKPGKELLVKLVVVKD
jgi:hypothetical protein